MSEFPISHKVIKSLRYRDMLNEILLDPRTKDTQKTFLVCFLRDQCGWEETSIARLICENARWNRNRITKSQFPDVKETNRQIERIFENCHKYQGSGSTDPGGTWTKDTQRAERTTKTEVETGRCCDRTTNEKNSLSRSGYLVSTGYNGSEQDINNMDQHNQQPVTIRTVTTANDGKRFHRIVEKEGKYGGFYSLESGWISDAEYEGKTIQVAGRPEKYFTLPNDPEVLKQIITGMQSLLPEEQVKQKKK